MIPEAYPYEPPKVEFLTKVFHPNISGSGTLCVDILEPTEWAPSMTLQKLAISILSLLTDPNPEEALCPDIGKLYLRDKKKYEAIATEWTIKYAK